MKPLILLHGWGTHPVIWQPLLRRLSHARALPLPGYADSAPVHDLDAMAERLIAEVEHGSILAGWSLGGLVAMRMAARAPEKISRLVLIGTTPCFVNRPDWQCGVDDSVFGQFAENLVQDYVGTIRRFLALQALGSEALKLVLSELRRQLLSLPQPGMPVLKAGLSILRQTDMRQSLHLFNMPVSLIHGTADRLAPIAAARWMAGQIPRADLHEIKGAAHAPFLSHAEAVLKVLHD